MIFFLLLAAVVVALDHLTKFIVNRSMALGHDIHILGEWVMLTHIKNPGAAFGLFPGSIVPLIVISVAASVVVIVMAVRAQGDRHRILPLGLILGGAVGNLIDRILLGRVTDFINVGIPDGPRWPVFNVADSAVTIGVAILAFGVYFGGRPEPEAAPAPPDGSPPGDEDTRNDALPGASG